MKAIEKLYADRYTLQEDSTGNHTQIGPFWAHFSMDQNGVLTVRIPVATLTEEQWKLLYDMQNEHQQNKTIKEMSILDTEIAYVFGSKVVGRKEKANEDANLLETDLQKLYAAGVRPGCKNCGKEGMFPMLGMAGIDTTVCAECEQLIRNELKQTLLADEEGRSVGRGLPGALLGAILGTAIFITVMVLTDRFFAILGMVTGYLAVWLYNKFRGKKTISAVVAIALITLIVSVIGYFVYVYFILNKYSGVTIDVFFANFSEVFKLPGLMSDLFMYLLFSVGGSILAMLSFLSEIRMRQQTKQSVGIEEKDSDVV